MPKLYKTEKVTCIGGEEVVVVGLISTDVEKKKILALYPDDSLTDSELVAYIEREERCRLRIDNIVGEASKRVEIDMEIPTGQTFYVGYDVPTGVSGDKFIVLEYELI